MNAERLEVVVAHHLSDDEIRAAVNREVREEVRVRDETRERRRLGAVRDVVRIRARLVRGGVGLSPINVDELLGAFDRQRTKENGASPVCCSCAPTAILSSRGACVARESMRHTRTLRSSGQALVRVRRIGWVSYNVARAADFGSAGSEHLLDVPLAVFALVNRRDDAFELRRGEVAFDFQDAAHRSDFVFPALEVVRPVVENRERLLQLFGSVGTGKSP
jgi:hypothetical protein